MRRPTTRTGRPASREHPWERARRLQFEQWAAGVQAAPYGRPLPDAIGFALAVEPPPPWSSRPQGRRLFAFSALPTGVGATFLARASGSRRPPPEGALVRLARPVKQVLPGPDPSRGELLLDGRGGILPVEWDQVVAGVLPQEAERVVPRLAEILRVAPGDVEELLLPLMGTIPWHGRREGLGTYLEVQGWSAGRHRRFLSELLDLVPEWAGPGRRRTLARTRDVQLASGAVLRRASPSWALPFAVTLRPISAPAPSITRRESPPTSMVRYGRAMVHEFAAELLAGHAPLLLSAEETSGIPRGDLDLPDAIRAAVWSLHWWFPEPPDAPDWHRWVGHEAPRLASALDRMPPVPNGVPLHQWSELVERREFREALAQWSFARARLRHASAVEQSDLARTIDAYAAAARRVTEWAATGRGPFSRAVDRSDASRTSRLRRALERLFDERPEGYTLDEARAALQSRGAPASAWELEHEVERLRIGGILYQDRSGRYRAVRD